MDDLGIIPGPIDASVLTLQAKHRSTDIWNNDMGGDIQKLILHCRRREAVLSRSNRPHPRIVSYLQRAGFYGLYCLRFIQLDWALISAFVERWRPETHTFHLPLGEMTITLQDMEVMLGLPVDGRPVIRSTILKWPELCGELLGVIPPPEKLVGCRLNMTWLSETFGVLPDNADEVTVQRYARAYILEMLGGSVFADTSGDLVHLLWLMFLDDFDTAGEYSWGSAALAWLYRQLCNAAKARTKDIGGALILVQLWAWSRFPRMTPEIVSIQPIDYGVDAAGQPLPQGPYGIRWCNAKCQKNVSTHVLRHYRSALGMQHPDEALKDGDSLMNIGKLKEALPYYEKVMDKLTFQSELHGLAALQWSICHHPIQTRSRRHRPNEARVMYESLQSHPNARGWSCSLGFLVLLALSSNLMVRALFKLANKSMALSPVDAAPPSPTPSRARLWRKQVLKAYLVFINVPWSPGSSFIPGTQVSGIFGSCQHADGV
uniref:Aminotransferase-like plant mobile domain-containing protein n=1 Tax=Fagus sylvatica TaxID=28930 RepID=A0A2N9F283_FAGSY